MLEEVIQPSKQTPFLVLRSFRSTLLPPKFGLIFVLLNNVLEFIRLKQ